MNDSDYNHKAYAAVRLTQPRKLLWITRGMMAFCGVLLGAVVISRPEVSEELDRSRDRLGGFFPAPGEASYVSSDWAESIENQSMQEGVEPSARPQVSTLPQSRVPVRRGGVPDSD